MMSKSTKQGKEKKAVVAEKRRKLVEAQEALQAEIDEIDSK